MQKKYLVKINIAGDSDACPLSSIEEFVHQRELDLVIKHLTESLEKACSYKTDLDKSRKLFRRVHDTITLAGSRGSGKTTFILSLQHLSANSKIESEEVKKKNQTEGEFKKPEIGDLQKVMRDIEFLGILDPTLIEGKDHVFLNIISRIKEIIDEKVNSERKYSRSEDDSWRKKYEGWECSLRRLSDGIPCIDGIGSDYLKSTDWQDSDFVMEQGLRRTRAATHLESDFHEFVKRSLDFLEKKAFLLCFDDIDTNFEKGWPIMETMRKFLTTPQLITLLTGDMGLYSAIIRQQQWKNFGREILEYEYRIGREIEKYQSAVTHLEEQYLQKLLKPERRISLNTLYQKEDTNLSIIKVKKIDESTEKTLGDFYNEGFKYLGIYDSTQQKTFYQFLANLPIRTQKQLLFAISENNSVENSNSSARETLEQSILDLFWSDLANKDVEVNILRDHPELMIIHLLRYLIRNKILFEGFNFRPVSDNIILNGAQFAAGVMISINIKNNSSEMFDYWFRICLSREIAMLFEKKISADETKTTDGPSLNDYLNHCSTLNKRSIRHITRNTTSYLRGLRSWYCDEADKYNFEEVTRNTWLGTVPLEITKSRVKESTQSILRTLENLDSFTKTLFAIPLTAVMEHKGHTLPVYSIYNLIGVIGEILETFDGLNIHILRNFNVDQSKTKYDQGENDPIKEAKNTIRTILFKDSQFRDYPLPAWASAKEARVSSPDVDGSSNSENLSIEILNRRFANSPQINEKKEEPNCFEQLNSLTDAIYNWYMLWYPVHNYPIDRKENNSEKDLHDVVFSKLVPPYLFAKIFTRFFYILSRIDKTINSKTKLSEVIYRMIIAFLHSVLIEEALEYLDTGIINKLSVENPVDKSHYFIRNLSEIVDAEGAKEKLNLSRWLLSCPLWYYYITPLDGSGRGKDQRIRINELLNEFCPLNGAGKVKNIFSDKKISGIRIKQSSEKKLVAPKKE